jgi:hypothetical protein
MRQKMILMAAMCLLLSAVAAFAQTKTDFSGDWTLDVSKSKLPEMMHVESGTMKVTQTDKDINIVTDFKRAAAPEGAGGGNGGGMRGAGGGMGRGGGGMMGGSGTMTYTLDGKETSVEAGGQMGGTVKLKSKWDKEKLKLNSTRNISTPMGEMAIITRETWEIVDGGNALKIKREMETPRGAQTSELYFTKQ